MIKALKLAYGLATSLLFAATALYAVGFLANLVPKSIDSGAVGPLWQAMLVDVALFLAFAIQHSVMSRQGFKNWWTRLISKSIERFTYVSSACLLLVLMFWLWRPIPYAAWHIEGEAGRLMLHALFWTGWLVVALAAPRTNLLRLRQILDVANDSPTLTTSGVYRVVRHPIYVGSLIGFWATPDMSIGHLLFSAMATAYTFVGTVLEERDLVRMFGDRYRRYQRDVPMLVPFSR